MDRVAGLASLIQAAVYAALVWYLHDKSAPLAGVSGLAAAAQVADGLVRMVRGPVLWVGTTAGGLGLMASALIVGAHAQVGVHLIRTFNELDPLGLAAIAVPIAALPWLITWPSVQVLRGRQAAAIAAAAGLSLLLPAMRAVAPMPTPPEPMPDGSRAAAWLLASDSSTPEFKGRGVVIATPLVRGIPGSPVWAEGRWSDALEQVKAELDSVDVVVLELGHRCGAARTLRLGDPSRWVVTPGSTGFLAADQAIPAFSLWRSDAIQWWQAFGGVPLPVVRADLAGIATGATAVCTAQWLATHSGVRRLDRGWHESAELDGGTALAAALAGGRHLVANMSPEGRFTYIVRGPSGESGKGYSFPRHAGTAWFLGELAQRTGDPQIAAGARASVAALAVHARTVGDGRTLILEKSTYKRAWIGTTALALLALVAADEDKELQRAMAAWLSSSIDERGAVRTTYRIDRDEWLPREHPYAQGQTVLALAAASAAGITDFDPALDRAARYLDRGYRVSPGSDVIAPDDHWLCLASLAVQQTRGHAHGQRGCDAYLAFQKHTERTPNSHLPSQAGGVAGYVEAIVAAAERDRLLGRDSHRRALAL